MTDFTIRMTPEFEQLISDLPPDNAIRNLVVEIDEMILRVRVDLAELRERYEKSEADWRVKMEKLKADIESTRQAFYAAVLERFEPRGNA